MIPVDAKVKVYVFVLSFHKRTYHQVDSNSCLYISCFLFQTPEGFSLDDLPIGHPTITREALESIADYTFTILRGLTLLGGQVKIDANMLQEMMMRVEGGAAIDHVVAILKPAALAFLEIESSVPKSDNALDFTVNRSSMDFDFHLSQKSYALTVNALSAIATNRPSFFHDAAVTLAQRAVNPPSTTDGGNLTRTATLVISSQLRASCLTLLRNASSITTNASDILHKALVAVDMELQADKALQMASQANQLKTASRSARNQAKMFYEWDASEVDRRSNKRQKETDDALAKMRAAKRQRGLGSGIQLPTSMSDAIELVLLNLEHLPKSRPSVGGTSSETPITLDFIVDAIMTNGGSLLRDEGRWYDRNGGTAWLLDVSRKELYVPGPSLLDSLETINSSKKETDRLDENAVKRNELFSEQSRAAASDAVRRILAATENSRWKSLAFLGSQLASRLAFILRRTEPSGPYREWQAMAKESATSVAKLTSEEEAKSLEEFMENYPLASSTIALVANATSDSKLESSCSHGESILNEAMMQSCFKDGDDPNKTREYDMSLNLLVASAVRASQLSKDKPNDAEKKKAAALAAARLQKELVALPRLTPSALELLCALCDIDDITKKATESSQKKSQEVNAASTAALYDAKAAAEKRATAVLLTLRDIALQRDVPEVRNSAVQCVVGLASGRLPTSASIHDKALKLTVNVFFPKNETIAGLVLSAVQSDLELAAVWAVDSYDEIQKANVEAQKKETSKSSNSLAPRSDVEKAAIEKLKRPSVLVMALSVRRIELVQRLFQLSCQEKAEALSKAVRLNMSKLAAATAAKYGVSGAALQVAEMMTVSETSMLLAFLDHLVLSLDKAMPSAEIVEACFRIQELKSTEDGRRDPRYLIPIVSGMKRVDLVRRLPEFVAAEDEIFLSALVRMGDRLGRHALHFRDEPDPENPSLIGMTLCEQLVFLHRLDFNAAGIPQKRYLAATKLCLENEMFSDQVLMSALDVMSGQFLTGEHKLPLAFMRTNIIVISNHESLHAWMSNVLLPRLVEGKIWSDPRQWEGWMRCAHMLEQSDDPAVSSASVVGKLPPEQLLQYRTKWAS
jgi:symplekin